MEIYSDNLKLAERLGNNHGIGTTLFHIGVILTWKGNHDKSFHYFTRSLKLFEELDDKYWIGVVFNGIGAMHSIKGDFDKALKYYKHSHLIRESLADTFGMGVPLLNIGSVYEDKGDFDTALIYYKRSLQISEEIGNKRLTGISFNNIGMIYYFKGDYTNAVNYLEKSLTIYKQLSLSSAVLLVLTIYLFLSYKSIGKKYDVEGIHILIKETKNLDFLLRYDVNYPLYQLLEDNSYLETAYNQVQEKADAIEEELGKKFLSYPIPKAIVEEWEKVK